ALGAEIAAEPGIHRGQVQAVPAERGQQPRRLAVRVPAARPLAAEADDLAPDVWCNAGHRVQRQQSRVNAFPGRRHRLFDAGLVEPFEATPVAGVESERADAAPGLERDT